MWTSCVDIVHNFHNPWKPQDHQTLDVTKIPEISSISKALSFVRNAYANSEDWMPVLKKKKSYTRKSLPINFTDLG